MSRNTIAFCAFAILVATAAWVHSWFRTPKLAGTGNSAQERGLHIDATSLDFGEVWEVDRFDWQLPVRNTSAEVIEVVDVMTSCHCHEADPRKFVLQPGSTTVVKLTLDLTARQTGEQGLSHRPFSSPVYFVLKGQPGLPEPVMVSGRVRSWLTADERSIHFGEEAVSGGQPRVRFVGVKAHIPVTGIRASAPPGVATVTVHPVAAGEGKYRLAISPGPELPPGQFKFDVVIDAVGTDGQTLPGVKMTAVGSMSPPARMLPSQVLFGARPVGSSADAELTLTVPAGEKWSVERIDVESVDVRVEPVNGGLVSMCYRVRQQVREKGDRSNKVWFVVAREGELDRPLKIEVTISYTGIGPEGPAKSEEGGS